MIIELTDKQKKEDKARASFAALIQAIPFIGGFGSAFVTLSDHFRPNNQAKAVLSTIENIEERVSKIENAIVERELSYSVPTRLMALSYDIAITLCTYEGYYLEGPIEASDIFSAYQSVDRYEIEDALTELDKNGLIRVGAALGAKFHRLNRCPELFFIFDAVSHGWIPLLDAIHLGELMQNDKTLCNAEKLEKYTGWERRRLNSALLYLREHVFEEQHMSGQLQAEYAMLPYTFQSEERYQLRRLKQILNAV